jgi:hypothetical protein
MPIVARFIYRRDIELVLKNGYRLRNTPYGAKEQFPVEIENRRRIKSLNLSSHSSVCE